MSPSYRRGYLAGLRGQGIDACPYEGHCTASMTLQRRWMDGRFDAITRRRKRRKRYAVRRKSVRTKWPRSNYARSRLVEILREARLWS